MNQSGGSYVSYALALVLVASSYLWLDFAGDSLLEMRSDSGDGPTTISGPSTTNHKKKSYRELKMEVNVLKREVKDLRMEVHKYRKLENEDLHFLEAKVNGSFYRLNKSVFLINLGEDFNIEKGDLAVQGDYVIGKVIDVSKTCALVETSCSPYANFFVRIQGNKEGEFIWSGKGDGKAVVHIDESIKKITQKNKILLSASSSLGGNFLLGEVTKVEKQTQKNWLEVIIKAKKVDPFSNVRIVKETEKKTRDLFERPDELSKLKKRVKELELIKLRLELQKK